ncbi:GNAT family N-acetyltransferase [Anaerosporobacter sp.]
MLIERDMPYSRLRNYIVDTTSYGLEGLNGKEKVERETCIKQAVEDMDKLLPNDMNTTNSKIKEYVDEDGQVIGALWTTVQREEDYLLLNLIHVKEEQRGKGYGKKLMDLVIEEASEKGLELVALGAYKANKAAVSLYKKCGFIIFDEEETRYNMLRLVNEN